MLAMRGKKQSTNIGRLQLGQSIETSEAVWVIHFVLRSYEGDMLQSLKDCRNFSTSQTKIRWVRYAGLACEIESGSELDILGLVFNSCISGLGVQGRITHSCTYSNLWIWSKPPFVWALEMQKSWKESWSRTSESSQVWEDPSVPGRRAIRWSL